MQFRDGEKNAYVLLVDRTHVIMLENRKRYQIS